jgi:hypothetical protein
VRPRPIALIASRRVGRQPQFGAHCRFPSSIVPMLKDTQIKAEALALGIGDN